MRAAFCTEPGRIELREVPRPSPAPGEVLVRVRSCGICGSDLHWFQGGFPAPEVCPGHEIAGEIVAVGSGVTAERIGERVTVEPLAVCGQCGYCRTGDYQLCPEVQLVGFMRQGGFADYLPVPVCAVYPLPESVEFALGSLTEPMAVCVHGVRLAHVTMGDRVLVLGAGTIGLLSILAARASGATEVAITARHSQQANMARQLGATCVFAANAEGEAERAAWGSERPADVVIETVGGTADTLNDAIGSVRAGGTVLVLGVFTTPPTCAAMAVVVKEVRLVGSLTYGRKGPRSDFDVALALLAGQGQSVNRMITHHFELAAVQAGFEAASDKSRGVIKVTVTPE